jgi:hypothetical protein
MVCGQKPAKPKTMSDRKPEHVVLAATRFRNEQTFVGILHVFAETEACECFHRLGLSQTQIHDLMSTALRGFISSTGRFLSRQGAYLLAVSAGQLPTKTQEIEHMDAAAFDTKRRY